MDRDERALDQILTSACPGEPGDLIVFHRASGYDHYGVNAGNELIHKTSDLNLGNVASGFSEIQSLLSKSSLAVVKKENCSEFINPEDYVKGNVAVEGDWKGKTPFASEEILKRCEEKVGERGYNVFTNNCEHLARYCRYGEARSDQADDLISGLKTAGGGAVAAAGAVGAVWAVRAVSAGAVDYLYNRSKEWEDL